MKASEIVEKLQKLISDYGDLPVAFYGDHELVERVDYNSKSWVAVGTDKEPIEAFEFNGYGDIGNEME